MPLVSADWLREHLGDHDLVVVDCRWSLTEPGGGRRAYEAGHVPGAVHLDVDADLSGPPGERGRHPLPAPDAFARTAARAGIGASSNVVAYDEGNGGAARLWWLLRHFGHDRAHVLNGGIDAWDGELQRGATRAAEPTVPFVPHPRTDDTATTEEIASDPSLLLIDARAPERFRGDREPIDPVAGHIPGARNVPFTRPELLGGDEFVAYCGSGITASVLVLHAAERGIPARLYPGSWSEWCRRGLPAETGDPS